MNNDSISVLRDIKGPVDFPFNLNLFLLIVILVVVLALALWLISRGKKTKPAPAMLAKSAYETAWEQLERSRPRI